MEEEKSLYSKHKFGLWSSLVVLVLTAMLHSFYAMIQSSFEASLAVKQLEDSVVTYSIVQKFLYGNLGSNLIWGIGIIVTIMCLIPTIKDVLKSLN